jgi:hypothetical protein
LVMRPVDVQRNYAASALKFLKIQRLLRVCNVSALQSVRRLWPQLGLWLINSNKGRFLRPALHVRRKLMEARDFRAGCNRLQTRITAMKGNNNICADQDGFCVFFLR